MTSNIQLLIHVSLLILSAQAFVISKVRPSLKFRQDSSRPEHSVLDRISTQVGASLTQDNTPFFQSDDVTSKTVPIVSLPKNNNIELKSFVFDGYKLTYMYKPPSPQYRSVPPILLIHPVGIGMSSWFWKRLMEQDGPAMYALDLIGCGLAHGADAWDPNQRGMSVPLAWVKACEALMQEQVLSKRRGRTSSFSSLFPSFGQEPIRYAVVAQGGLAPVGLLLTARNLNAVSHLVLTSPPTDLSTPVSENELARNYAFFNGRLSSTLAFGMLETRAAVRFFSNLFLFANPCDQDWLDEAETETCVEGRPPVQVFNAGFCQARSYDAELQALDEAGTPVLVLQGQGDTARNKDRLEYYTNKLSRTLCRVETLPGKNVLPWEFPDETAKSMWNFLGLV